MGQREGRYPITAIRSLLSIRNFRLFLAGQFVSNTGTWMQWVAQDWLVLRLTDNSGTALGLVTGLQFGPQLVFGLLGGVIADRFGKRRVLLATQSAMGVQALLLGLLVVTGHVQLWHVYALAVLGGTMAALDAPARQTFLHDMVGREHLPRAVGLNSAQMNAARVIGPALAGLLIAAVSTGPVFLLNAASYLAVLAGLLLMRLGELRTGPPAPGGSGNRADRGLRVAFAYLRRSPELLLPIVIMGFVGAFGINFQITIALVNSELFGGDARRLGYLSAAFAVGGLVGALAATFRRTPPTRRLLIGSVVAFGVYEALLGLVPSYPVFLGALVVAGVLTITVTTTANSITQVTADARLRGRVMSVYMMVFLGGTPIGAPTVGWIAEHLGVRWSLVLGGLVSVTVAVAAAMVFRPAARKVVHVGHAARAEKTVLVEPAPAVTPSLPLSRLLPRQRTSRQGRATTVRQNT